MTNLDLQSLAKTAADAMSDDWRVSVGMLIASAVIGAGTWVVKRRKARKAKDKDVPI